MPSDEAVGDGAREPDQGADQSQMKSHWGPGPHSGSDAEPPRLPDSQLRDEVPLASASAEKIRSDLETQSRSALSKPQFLHPSSIVFGILANIRKFIIPAAVGLFTAAQGGVWGFGVAGFVFGMSILGTLFRYFTLRYRLDGTDLVVSEGFIFRRVRSVPIHRIQNMDLVQSPIHRFLGVAEVNIETASGNEPEATLRVLTQQQITDLRTALFGSEGNALQADLPNRANSEGTSTTQDHTGAVVQPLTAQRGNLVHSIPLKDLLIAGLASNRGMVIVGILFGFVWQFDLEERFDIDWLIQLNPEQADSLQFALWGIVLVIAFFLLLRLFGMAWYVHRFFGYELREYGEDLRVSCGLFTKVTATIPRRRIQFITVHRPLLLRYLSLASVRIETAGGSGTNDENANATVARRWFLPVVPEEDVNAILRKLRHGLDWSAMQETVEWHGVSPFTERRLLRLASLGVVCLAMAIVGISHSRGWTLIAAIMLGIAVGLLAFLFLALVIRKKARSRRFARNDFGVVYQSGLLTRKLSFAFFDRIQSVAFMASPFDRRWKMATLAIDTAAAGPAEHRIQISYLDDRFAREQYLELAELATAHLSGQHDLDHASATVHT